MKTGPEIDDALRRYRPAGPPPELRTRVIAGTAPAGRTWPWAAAAAALLLFVAALHLSTSQLYRSLAYTVVEPMKIEEVPGLRGVVGDDRLLQDLLERITQEEQGDAPAKAVQGEIWR